MEMTRAKSWEEGDVTDGNAEYSEFQRPYMQEPGNDEYAIWEWEWPVTTPIDIITAPDPVPNPCNFDDGCQWAKVIGSDEVRCGSVATYTQAHFWEGCKDTPWWAAFGSWALETDSKEIVLISQNPVMATVSVSDDATTGDVFKIIYYGPGCTDSLEATIIDCACCKEFTITGDATVNPGVGWVGRIEPACPLATCEMLSNSECTPSCEVYANGSRVLVTTAGSDCGSVTVTVSYEDEDENGNPCSGEASKTIRINDTGQGGSWEIYAANSADECGAYHHGCGGNSYAPYYLIDEGKRVGGGANCGGNWARECLGCSPNAELGLQNTPPPENPKALCDWPSPFCPTNYYCSCTRWGWVACEWLCAECGA
jgi:hypothetical protein